MSINESFASDEEQNRNKWFIKGKEEGEIKAKIDAACTIVDKYGIEIDTAMKDLELDFKYKRNVEKRLNNAALNKAISIYESIVSGVEAVCKLIKNSGIEIDTAMKNVGLDPKFKSLVLEQLEELEG